MPINQPDFLKIFASAAALGELLNWPDESYLRGWGYLKESEPPPMEFFNALMNLSDAKDKYLFQAINIRMNRTQYHVDDVVTTPNLESKYQLVCIQEGVTADAEPTLSNIEGEEVIDGACKWRITSRAANEVTVSEEEPINARDQAVWLALNANNDIAKLKYRTPQKTWKQLLLENKLSAILDSPIKSLERSTTYKKNDILSDATLKGGFLVCVTAGTTGTSIPSGLASATEGASITDGTAVFSVHYFYNIASLISPTFTGTPKAPTAAKGTNTTQIATMAAIINALADYAKKESPILTGEPKAPTAAQGTAGDIIATCAYVLEALSSIDLSDYALTTDLEEYAKKVSPSFSGTPTAPTAAKGTNTTQLATTEFVFQNANPVGTIIAMAYTGVPAGYLHCNGAAVSRTTYAALFALLGTYYGAGDGYSTFNLPNTVAKFLEGGIAAGTYYDAGLPNVRQYIGRTEYTTEYPPVSPTDIQPNFTFADSTYAGQSVASSWVDLASSNAIYGNSATVQPPAMTVIYCIKY